VTRNRAILLVACVCLVVVATLYLLAQHSLSSSSQGSATAEDSSIDTTTETAAQTSQPSSWPTEQSSDTLASPPPAALADGEAPAHAPGVLQEGTTIYMPHPTRPGHVICTVGAILSTTSALTAGHCGTPGTRVYLSTDDTAQPVAVFSTVGDDTHDLATLTILPGTPVGRISTLSPRLPAAGEPIAKVGAATARTTGLIRSADIEQFPLLDHDGTLRQAHGDGIRAAICADQGDSGAPVYEQGTHRIVAILIAAGASKTPSWCFAYLAPTIWVTH